MTPLRFSAMPGNAYYSTLGCHDANARLLSPLKGKDHRIVLDQNSNAVKFENPSGTAVLGTGVYTEEPMPQINHQGQRTGAYFPAVRVFSPLIPWGDYPLNGSFLSITPLAK
jgi:hypothetical protein